MPSPLAPGTSDPRVTRTSTNPVRHPLDVTVERAPVGIAHFDYSGRFLYANPMLCEIFGLTREQLLARTFQELSFAEELTHCLELNAQLASGLIPKYALEKRFKRPDGSFAYTRVNVTLVPADGLRTAYFLGIVEDLSEQWALEQARRGAEERLSVALAASRTGIYRYDFATEALEWSSGLAELFEFPEGDQLQSLGRLLGAVHGDDLAHVLSAYERSLTTGADFEEEFRIVLPDGSIRWLRDRARMTLDATGKPKHLTGACTEITTPLFAEDAKPLNRGRGPSAGHPSPERTTMS